MYESGYYPAGAEHATRAPWNCCPVTVPCPACGGKGRHWRAYDFVADEMTECGEEEWNALPETEEEAEAKGLRLVRDWAETCDVCFGSGEAEYEHDYDDYEDEY